MRNTSLVLGLLPLLWLALPSGVVAQSQLTSWTIPTDHPGHLGQAQQGRVCVSENDVNSLFLKGTLGNDVGGVGFGALGSNNLTPAETTDDSLIVTTAGPSNVWKFSRSGALQRVVTISGSPASFPGRPVPLLDGQVMFFYAGQFRTLDRNLNQIAAFPVAEAGGPIGIARRKDGAIVTCHQTPLLVSKLIAYSPAGTVLFNIPIPAGGPIALAADGSIYVCHGANASSLDVYAANGSPGGSWSGPPGQPLAGIKDITASPAGDLLFTLSVFIGGPVRVFQSLPVAGRKRSWSEVKAAYR
jgi:hypothetical protein